MRMKEDHMKNGQLKPGYNWQFSTNNQFVVNYTVEQAATDTTTLPGHLLEHEKLYGEYPQLATADSGYGSEENYEFLEDSILNSLTSERTLIQEKNNVWSRKRQYSNIPTSRPGAHSKPISIRV